MRGGLPWGVFHGLHEDFFEGAFGAAQSFDFAPVGAQEIDGAVGFFARGEEELKSTVVRVCGAGGRSQLRFEPLRDVQGFDAIAAAVGQFLHGPGERDFAFLDDRDLAAEEFHFGQQMRIQEDGDALLFEVLQNVADVFAADRIDAVAWLVEHQQLRASGCSACARPTRCSMPLEYLPRRR